MGGNLFHAEVFKPAEHENFFHTVGQVIDGLEQFLCPCFVIYCFRDGMRLRIEMFDELLQVFTVGSVFPVDVDDLVAGYLVQVCFQ